MTTHPPYAIDLLPDLHAAAVRADTAPPAEREMARAEVVRIMGLMAEVLERNERAAKGEVENLPVQ